ncbi:uncharacterized protein BO80DRAFT_472925 [Aspergillus ibericus CBS 121593]|uniref:Uncharacterized protein n=1 Tax=Aspergillus ibericus CBS 121593 TaxID=1448316 RepID=A0A395H208_9EURO|nr:hypothetical protein BO80DRAFT_472925 [Aspergillus ibericus CBS 121593]RAL01806.1 hypothetical protein BO80DRAFT_472925 [Aspergillus ibericus CBS 121593]
MYLNSTVDDDDVDDPAYHSVGEAALEKRVFESMTLARIREYLPQQTDPNTVDTYFGNPTGLIQFVGKKSTDASVARQTEFGSAPFQIGTDGLVGCTIVTVVSKRAVYMGHYWEEESWSSNYYFPRRVLNFIAGRQPQQGIGPAFNPALFNRPDDDTRVYIMHPRRGIRVYTSAIYRGKLTQLRTLFNQNLLPGVPIATWMYIPVNPRRGQPDPIADQPWRRHAIFQYDPNAHGAGNRGWRLFYEDHYFDDTNPPPGPASANGIPDLP